MFNRVLLLTLTSVATCGLNTAAIAQNSKVSIEAWKLNSGIVISQASDAEPQQPSAAIQSLQNRLVELGYYDGPVNGLFGDATRDALSKFQQDHGLVGTGILDPLTQQRLADPTGTQSPADGNAAPPNAAETESGSPEAAPTLDLPPVSENGEVETPTPPPDGVSTPAGENVTEGAAGTTAENDTNTTEGAADAAPAPDKSGLPIFLLVGALILILGGIGGGIAIWLLKRQKQDDTLQSVSGAAANVTDDPAEAPSRAMPSPSLQRPKVTDPKQNGSSATGQELAFDVQHRSMPINNLAEPRVAKVNIVDELIQDLQLPEPELRRKAIWELGQRGNSAAMQPLVNLLTQVDSQEQSLILAALAEITSQTLKPMNRAVMIALQSEDAEVRKNAIRDLTRIFDSLNQSGRMLGHVAIDDDPDVRQTANWALDQLNKMRSNATDAAAFLKESDSTQERLPEDGTSSQ